MIKEKRIWVLDYQNGLTSYFDVDILASCEEIESIIKDKLELSLESCYWMATNNIESLNCNSYLDELRKNMAE